MQPLCSIGIPNVSNGANGHIVADKKKLCLPFFSHSIWKVVLFSTYFNMFIKPEEKKKVMLLTAGVQLMRHQLILIQARI